MMQLAIAAATLRGSGSSLVGQMVVKNLLAGYPEDKMLLLAPTSWEGTASWAVDFSRSGQLSVVPCGAGMFEKLYAEFWNLPRLCRSGSIQAVFSMGDTGTPRLGIPHLLFVQQPFLAVPQSELDFPLKISIKMRLAAMAGYFRLGLRGVTRFTVQTEYMRQRLSRLWSIAPESIDVTPSAPAPEMIAMRCSPRWDLPPYFVYLCHPGPHKNIGVMPAILRRLRDGGLPIRCVLTVTEKEVAATAMEAERLRVRDLIDFRGRVGRQEAASLLEGAVAHVLPSKLESFGLGYVEAMAMGCPVVAADREFAREICGDAAMYAPADSSEQFAAHLASLLSSQDIWLSRAEAGRRRFLETNLTWAQITARYRSLLAEMAG